MGDLDMSHPSEAPVTPWETQCSFQGCTTCPPVDGFTRWPLDMSHSSQAPAQPVTPWVTQCPIPGCTTCPPVPGFTRWPHNMSHPSQAPHVVQPTTARLTACAFPGCTTCPSLIQVELTPKRWWWYAPTGCGSSGCHGL